jgi:MFS family permease
MNSTLTQPNAGRTARPGTVRAALGYRDFRIIWIGLFASNIGTWMQNLALPAYVDERTRQASWVALMSFALLGPLLLLSIPGGVLANRFPRKQWLLTHQGLQMCFAVLLALLISRDASLWAIFCVQLGIGISNALSAPALQSSVPQLVSKEDLPGALSLNSVMLNGARVIGPVVAALLLGLGLSVSQLFLVNAVTYLFAIAAIASVTLPAAHRYLADKGLSTLLTGLRIARSRTVLSRLLLSLTLFSFVCLPFVGFFPSVARLAFGIESRSATYKWLYATWGFGAMLGGLACGTVLARFDRYRLITIAFRGFAVMMFAFALARGAVVAIPIGFFLGFFYFLVVTPMAIVFQQNLRDSERALVMSLWFMAFGGTVTLGALAFGPIVDRVGPRPVLMASVVGALVLSWWCDLSRRPVGLLSDEERSDALEAGNSAAFDQNGIVAGQ